MPFSLLMSTYHRDNPEYLEEALASLTAQTVLPGEIIIMGDGAIPTENRLVIEQFSEQLPIRFIPIKKHIGLGGALSLGLSKCTYPLVARFDTDDICEPHRFERQLQHMESNPTIDVCGSYATLIDMLGKTKGELKRPLQHNHILKVIWSCPIIHPSIMMRKERILKAGNYRSLPIDREEDHELWIRAARHGLIFHNIPEPLIRYRRTETTKQPRNTISTGFARLWYGFPAWLVFDRRPHSLLALTYPTVRPLLPRCVNDWLFTYYPREKHSRNS